MHEILRLLKSDDYVLDLGSRSGSFPASATFARAVRFDLEHLPLKGLVQGDAGRLPFRDGAFAAVIANHSLEHIVQLDSCLKELKRVLRAEKGYLYVAVPDASTLSDVVYRWLSHGGGHVNAIRDPNSFGAKLSSQIGLRLAATRLLYSSFAFANSKGPVRWSRRRYLLGGGSDLSLRLTNSLLRKLDRLFNSRLSLYGWAFYFGDLEKIDEVASTNVCVRCGAGHVSEWLIAAGRVKQGWLGKSFVCPECGVVNGFTDDEERIENRNAD